MNIKKNKVTQQLVSNSDLGNKSSFNKDLCKALLLSNIPLNKLSNNEFKSFLEKYTNESIPSETTLRKGYVDDIYQETLLKIRNYVDKKKSGYLLMRLRMSPDVLWQMLL